MSSALRIFFGQLIPVAQLPFADTMAMVLRADLPVAVASNPGYQPGDLRTLL